MLAVVLLVNYNILKQISIHTRQLDDLSAIYCFHYLGNITHKIHKIDHSKSIGMRLVCI